MSMLGGAAASPIRDHYDDDSVSQDYDREAFDRWCRLVRVEPEGYGEYPDIDEYERRFKYFKDSLRRKVSPEMIDFGINMLQFADRSEQEFKDLTFHSSRKYCYVSHELLDVWEEINSRPHDSCYFAG